MKNKLLLFLLVLVILFISHSPIIAADYEDDEYEEEIVVKKTTSATKWRAGLGFGIPYGVLGVNFEIGLNDLLSLCAGIGIYPSGNDVDNFGDLEIGYSVGGRIYFAPRKSHFRPRINLLRGTVAINKSSDSFIEGFAPGLGFDWKVSRKLGMDFDLLYPIYDQPKGTHQEGGAVKISIGFGYYFGKIAKKAVIVEEEEIEEELEEDEEEFEEE
ncbi:MAG: hypothetical protein PHD29_00185 [bacterium]|nr:hypothetical protein [bacterium]MDD5354543.1 hypothetical protein [bacterium]MDD5757117.1 hypothetical protein [bacterium]